MDKYDFINRIIALYPLAIKDSEARYDLYSRALSKDKIDYDKLMDVYANEYSENFPPTSIVLKEMSKKCIKEEATCENTWIHFRIYNPILKCITTTDCFPSGTTEEAAINSYKKKFPNSEGWKILNVYKIGG